MRSMPSTSRLNWGPNGLTIVTRLRCPSCDRSNIGPSTALTQRDTCELARQEIAKWWTTLHVGDAIVGLSRRIRLEATALVNSDVDQLRALLHGGHHFAGDEPWRGSTGDEHGAGHDVGREAFFVDRRDG
jgi:hypothetical protein